MIPFDQIARVYDMEPCARTLQEDLVHHLRGGFVFARPDFFIMGRPVIKGMPASHIVNPTYHFPSSECDCWHIYAMAGNMAKAWTILPWELPWFSFERKNELRYYRAAAIRRLSLARLNTS